MTNSITVRTRRLLVKIKEVELYYKIELSLSDYDDFYVDGDIVVLAEGYCIPIWLDPTFIFYIPQNIDEAFSSLENLKSIYGGETPLDSLIEEALYAVKSVVRWKDNNKESWLIDKDFKVIK